jgi:type I restriction enzyme S subunit
LVQKIIDAEKTTNAQPKLALTRIKEFLIPIPNKEEQELKQNTVQSMN